MKMSLQKSMELTLGIGLERHKLNDTLLSAYMKASQPSNTPVILARSANFLRSMLHGSIPAVDVGLVTFMINPVADKSKNNLTVRIAKQRPVNEITAFTYDMARVVFE
jgi:hypothetical protein